MSHFSVLVIGDEPEKQLAPFHEFECTGEDNEYVQDVDITEEAREEYTTDTTTCYEDADGVLHRQFTPKGDWEPRLFRDPTPEETEKYGLADTTSFANGGKTDDIEWYKADWHDGLGYRAKIKSPPEGWVMVEVKTSLLETFTKYAEGYHGIKAVPFGQQPDKEKHKYGYILVDEAGEVIKVVDRTNENKHWDWYQIGGRWNGFFKLKANPQSAATLGRPGLQTMDRDYEPVGSGYADQCRKGDIDIDGMRDAAGKSAAEQYDKYAALTAGCPPLISWEDIQAKHTVDEKVDYQAARLEYHEQPMVKAVHSDRDAVWWNLEDFQYSREEYIEDARNRALQTFAVVKDSQWYERGSMGWWGCVSDEKDDNEWGKQFSGLFNSLPDDTLLTMVDCHI